MVTKDLAVIHLTPHFYWPQLEKRGWPVKFDAMGGMQNQIYRLTNFLDRQNIQQLVITLKIPGIPKFLKISKSLAIVSKRIPILSITSRIRGMVDLNISWFLGTMFYLIKNRVYLKRKYQIIHSHCSGVSFPLLAGYFAAKILGLPLITSIHCSAIATYKPMNFLDKYLHKLNIFVEKKVLGKSTHIIFLTKKSMEICSQYVKKLPSISSIISDSIDSEYFHSLINRYSKEDFINQYKIPTCKPICIFVGRIAREKGWRDIIVLAKTMSEKYHFLIIGDGNEYDLMRAEIRNNNLEDCFTLTGYIAQEKVPLAMSLATVLVLPSRHEEFGSVLLESMTIGLVSIAYNVGGVSNVITHRKDGLLAHNLQEMIGYLKEILEDTILRENLSIYAQEKVKVNFQVSKIGKKILNIYQKILLKGKNE